MPEVRFGGKDGTTVRLPPEAVMVTRVFDEPIRNLRTSQVQLVVGEAATVDDVRVGVDIAHSWIGDLVVTLDPPAAMGVAPITLHDRAGGSGHDLRRSYDVNSVPALAGCRGQSAEGAWTLIVEDKAADDVGRIRGLTLEFTLSNAERAAEPTRSRRRRVAVTG